MRDMICLIDLPPPSGRPPSAVSPPVPLEILGTNFLLGVDDFWGPESTKKPGQTKPPTPTAMARTAAMATNISRRLLPRGLLDERSPVSASPRRALRAAAGTGVSALAGPRFFELAVARLLAATASSSASSL